MRNRRAEPRMLCADIVDVSWRDKAGKLRRAIANLEDISLSGACLQLEQPVPLHTEIKISLPKGELAGRVCYCVFRETGYFLGLEFQPGCKWSMHTYRPQHLLDPRRLVARATRRLLRQNGVGSPPAEQ